MAGNVLAELEKDRSAFPIEIAGTERSFFYFTPRSTKPQRETIVPGVDFDRLRAEITIEQVLQLLGFQAAASRGDQWYGRCLLPGCSPSEKPCFSVNLAIGRYCCHRCHRHGHQLELWAAATGLPLHAAAIDLCAALGREVPWVERW